MLIKLFKATKSIHPDFAPRNIMIESKTNKWIAIDFERSFQLTENECSNVALVDTEIDNTVGFFCANLRGTFDFLSNRNEFDCLLY